MTNKEIVDLYCMRLPLAFLQSAIVHNELSVFTCIKFIGMEKLTPAQIADAFHQYTPNEPMLKELIKSYKDGILHNSYIKSFELEDPNYIDVGSIFREIVKIAQPYKYLLRKYGTHAENQLMTLLIEGETFFY